jgi:predicted nucleic acid-binding protein
MLIVDASCLFEIVAGTVRAEPIRRRLSADADHVAPHLIDAEVLGVIRRHEQAGLLDATTSRLAVEDLHDWPGERVSHRPLLRRAWELRRNVRTWDALYVALAEAFDAPLVTLDERLASATGVRCQIEVMPG